MNGTHNLPGFSKEMKIRFQFFTGICEYLCGLESGELWDAMGVKGKSTSEYIEAQKKRLEKLESHLTSDEFIFKVKNFTQKVERLFNAILHMNSRIIDDYIKSRTFYFVIGASRTGGTYVYKEISRAVGWPWKDVYYRIVHDAKPDTFLYDNRHETGHLGWRRPKKFYKALFQICEILVYFNEEFKTYTHIVLKNWTFSHALGLLDRVFGSNGHYLVTVRHPAASSASRAEHDGVKNTPQHKQDRFNQWVTFYREIVRDAPYDGSINTLLFGSNMDEYLSQFMAEHNSNLSVEGLDITERQYNNSFWNQTKIQNKLTKLNSLWSAHGYSFPTINNIV